jgi:hypothetical protein
MDCGRCIFARARASVIGGFYYFANICTVASNDRMTGELSVRKDLEGSGCSLIEVLSRHFPGGPEENYENVSQDSR